MTKTKTPGSELSGEWNNACNGGGVAGAPKSGTIGVLLVDDSIRVRQRVADALSEVEGVVVVGQAGDVPAGLRLADKYRPDVVVLDVELPGLSGLELLKKVKSWSAAPVVIMLSIHDHPRMRQQCLDLGANFYFTKRTEFEKPEEVCRELVSRRREQGQPPFNSLTE